MAGYSKEFLLDALCARYGECFEGADEMALAYRDMCAKHYDKVGKDEFRKHASLDAEAIKVFKAKTGRKG